MSTVILIIIIEIGNILTSRKRQPDISQRGRVIQGAIKGMASYPSVFREPGLFQERTVIEYDDGLPVGKILGHQAQEGEAQL